MAESFQPLLQPSIDPLIYRLMGTLMIAHREYGNDKLSKHTRKCIPQLEGLGDL